MKIIFNEKYANMLIKRRNTKITLNTKKTISEWEDIKMLYEISKCTLSH